MEKLEQVNTDERIGNTAEAERNPNSIGELLSIGRDLPTRPDSVYRSVRDAAAIDDLFANGVVRNAFSAGAKENSRWGDKIFWSRGAEGKFHVVQRGGYVIEAPYDIASKRVVTREDVTAIYSKQEDNRVVDVLPERRQSAGGAAHAPEDVARARERDARRIALEKELGIIHE